MNKYYLLVSLFLSSSVMVSAGPKQKKVETWIDASVKAKNGITGKAEEIRNADRLYLDEA